MPAAPTLARPLSNAEIAQRLLAHANQLRQTDDNPFKVRAYRRAAQTLRGLRENADHLVRSGGNLTRFPGIGKGIAGAVREIVFSGNLGQMEMPLTPASPEQQVVDDYPMLDPKRVARVFKKLGIASVTALKERLANGTIRAEFGPGMADHFRNAFRRGAILLDDADAWVAAIHLFLVKQCGVTRAECAGEVRRRLETVSQIGFVVETSDFPATVKALQKFRGGIMLVEVTDRGASFELPDSVRLTLRHATKANWGTALTIATGSAAHLAEMRTTGALRRRAGEETDVYASMGLAWVPPELREGRGEVAQAARGELPCLVELADIRGDLHMHTTSSDGLDTIAAMAQAARARGYDYVGITDHSQSLRIARGVSIERLWRQIREIDQLNARGAGIRILKSAEVDILADGSLDYPDDLLAALDCTICSIHSRFRLSKHEQTERVLRAMEHPAFSILGHATGRLLLKRSGYELDFPRVIAQAKACHCFFEINADPDRLDLSADNVREVVKAGVNVVINTDAHRVAGLAYMRYGVDTARRAGLEKASVLNTARRDELLRALRR